MNRFPSNTLKSHRGYNPFIITHAVHVAGSLGQRALPPGRAAHGPRQSGRVRRKDTVRRSATHSRRNRPGILSS